MTADETHDEYRARAGINWSRLKLARKSALHYRDTPPRPDTPTLGMLRAVHSLVLEPEHFDRDYAVWLSPKARRGKVYDAFREAHTGRTILSTKEHEEAKAIANAVHCHPFARRLLSKKEAHAEVVLAWTDADTGQACKGRADLVLVFPTHCWVLDLKTVRSLEPRQMAADVVRFGYHGQLAHYCAGVSALYDRPVTRCGLLCVESAAPHDVGCFWLDQEARNAGDALRARLLHVVARAEETGEYPGQCAKPVRLSLPPWAIDDAHGDTFTSSET